MFCTNCGAEITKQQRFCAHCGQAIGNVMDEETTSLEISKRSEDVAKRIGEELAQVAQPLTNLGICMQRAEVEKKNMERIQVAIGKAKKGDQNVALEVILIVLWCLMSFVISLRIMWSIRPFLSNSMADIVWLSLLAALAVGGSLMIHKLINPNAEKIVAKYQQEYNTSKKRYDELQQGCAINMQQCMPVLEKHLARDYWYMDAVTRISNYLRNGRAESIKEAINLYEEESHRMRMENLQYRTLVENQKQTVHTGILAVEAIARLL